MHWTPALAMSPCPRSGAGPSSNTSSPTMAGIEPSIVPKLFSVSRPLPRIEPRLARDALAEIRDQITRQAAATALPEGH